MGSSPGFCWILSERSISHVSDFLFQNRWKFSVDERALAQLNCLRIVSSYCHGLPSSHVHAYQCTKDMPFTWALVFINVHIIITKFTLDITTVFSFLNLFSSQQHASCFSCHICQCRTSHIKMFQRKYQVTTFSSVSSSPVLLEVYVTLVNSFSGTWISPWCVVPSRISWKMTCFLKSWVFPISTSVRKFTECMFCLSNRSGVSLAVRDNNGSFISTLSMQLYSVWRARI